MRLGYAARICLFCLAIAAASLSGHVACAQEKPSITVVFPSIDDVFRDFKLAFDLVGEKGDEKGYDTLKSTIETFLVGVDTTKAGGVRIYPTAGGLQPVLTFPVKNDQEFKKLLLNLWDLDIKTAPPPDAKLIRQIPPAVNQKAGKAKLDKTERLVFKLYDAFLRYEPGQVNFATLIETVRLAKGPLPVDLLKGHKLVALVDGSAQPQDKRKQGFAAAKKEMLAAIIKGEHENEALFEARKSLTEHQVAELERFFVEASKVFAGWNISSEQKQAELNIDLVGLPGSELEKSVELLGTTPDDFAGVSKTDAVFSLSANFALDPLRQAFVKNASKLHRNSMKKVIEDNAKMSAEEKAIDGDLVDLFFDIIEGTGELGIANLFVRGFKGSDGTINSVAGGRTPEGTKEKFEKILASLASRNPGNKLEQKFETVGDIELHKLTIPKLGEELPELIGKDGVVYVGTHAKTLWVASGDGGLELLKKTIGEVTAAGPKPGLVVELSLKMGPYIEILNNYYTRNPPAPAAPKAETSKPRAGSGAAPRSAKVEAFISPEDLRKIAMDVFKQGKDSLTLTLGRNEKTAEVRLKLDEGLIRFAGTAMSKFVKENLED